MLACWDLASRDHTGMCFVRMCILHGHILEILYVSMFLLDIMHTLSELLTPMVAATLLNIFLFNARLEYMGFITNYDTLHIVPLIDFHPFGFILHAGRSMVR